MRRALLVVVLLAATALAGCTQSQEDVRADYCEVVKEQQRRLSEIMADSGPTTLLHALPVFRTLQARAPRDIEDKWTRVVDALSGLDAALADAGVDPDSYRAGKPPEDVTRAQQRAISDAADELARPEVAHALEGVKTQALDVCKTPLYR